MEIKLHGKKNNICAVHEIIVDVYNIGVVLLIFI